MMSETVSLNELSNWSKSKYKWLKWGDVVGFKGEMGYGKTTIIRHLSHTFDKDIPVASPTFGVMNVHVIKESFFLLHIDAYRIKDESEIYGLGLDQYITHNSIIFIEWYENIPEYILMPNKIIDIQLSKNEDERLIHCFSV